MFYGETAFLLPSICEQSQKDPSWIGLIHKQIAFLWHLFFHQGLQPIEISHTYILFVTRGKNDVENDIFATELRQKSLKNVSD